MKLRAHAGQSLVEMSLILAVVAVVCFPAISFAREAFAAAYLVQQAALQSPVGAAKATKTVTVYVAPTATPTTAYSTPTSADQCKDGGWQTFNPPTGSFKNQGDCVSYVNTGK
jgi:hypothetical protein